MTEEREAVLSALGSLLVAARAGLSPPGPAVGPAEGYSVAGAVAAELELAELAVGLAAPEAAELAVDLVGPAAAAVAAVLVAVVAVVLVVAPVALAAAV